MVGDAAEDIGESGLGIDGVELRFFDRRVGDGGRFAAQATDPDVIARLHSAVAAGEVFEGTSVNYRKDGSPFDIRWSVVPVRGNDGTVSHYVTVQRDVSPSTRS